MSKWVGPPWFVAARVTAARLNWKLDDPAFLAHVEEILLKQLEHVPSDFADPDWSLDTGVHEWKAYISEELRVLWSTLSSTLQQVLARDADRLADQEEYE